MERPDAYAELQDRVRLYEGALNLLLGEGVVYYSQRTHERLREAVLELRSIVMGGQHDRERWNVWPVSEPTQVSVVLLASDEAKLIRVGTYEVTTSDGRVERVKGVPRDEPIWLKSISPDIVWQRVVPVVAAQEATGDADSIVDVSDWVISDRLPTELTRPRPTRLPLG